MRSISRTAILATGVSFTGVLSLSLSGLLPWPAFFLVSVIHVWAVFNFSTRIPVTAVSTLLLTLAVFLVEASRIVMLGSPVTLHALRDIIVFFAVLRLVLPKTGREIHQIVGIALAECILSTIFTESPLFLVGLLLMAALAPMVLSSLDGQDFGDQRAGREGPLHWSAVYLGITVTACILFFVIPRPSSAIIRHGLISNPRTGFSEETHLARSTRLEEDRQILVRIFWDQGRMPDAFYLSGARLDFLSEAGFIKGQQKESPFIPSGSFTDKLQIYLADLDSLNVFYPFAAASIEPAVCSWKGLNLYWARSIPPVYEARVDRTGDRKPPVPGRIPEGLEGVAALGRMAAGEGPLPVRIQRLVIYLSTHCAYTLDGLDIPRGVSPIRWFVFDGSRGSCEHFASALAVMLQGCGVPSRVVTGFFVHEFNTAGGYFVVRADDAHAWVEYFAQGSWHTLEATPQAVNTARQGPGIIDALRFRWIRWVIRYSLEDQVSLAIAVFSAPRRIELEVGRSLPAVLGASTVVLLLVLFLMAVRERRAGLYASIVRAFGSKGVRLDPRATHEDHCREVARQWPAISPDFQAFLEDYLSWRFGGAEIEMGARTKEMLAVIRDTEKPRREATG